MTFQPGSLVRFRQVRGPKMLLLGTMTGLAPNGLPGTVCNVMWFDRNDMMHERTGIAEQWLEEVPAVPVAKEIGNVVEGPFSRQEQPGDDQ